MTIPFLALSGITAATQGLDSALGVLWSTPGYRMIFVGPLTMLSFMHVASRKGILLKSGRALERLYSVDTVVFDKTGTLTLAQPTMGEIFSFAGLSEQDILKLAVAAEGRQTHPIAVAIRSAARQRAIVAPSMDDPEVAVGFGVKAVIEGRQILVGSERLMKLHGVAFTPSVEAQQKSVHEKGNTLIFIASEGSLVGAIEVCPTVRPEARTLIEELMRRGKRVHILSGDHDEPTRSLAARLGVDSYFAEILPEGKAKIIDSLRAKGHKICFVGDGINDSIAMQRADVSISIRGAASLATTIAQIVLLSGDLETLLPLFDMTERFEWYMKVNRLASSLPAFIISAGIMLLGWSYLTAILLNQISMPFALYSLFGPALEHQAEEAEKKCARALPNVAHGLTS